MKHSIVTPMKSSPFVSIATAFATSLIFVCSLVAQPNVWTGVSESGSSTNQWSQSDNWSLGTVPNGAVDVLFENYPTSNTNNPSNNTAITIDNMSITRTNGQLLLRFFSNTLAVNNLTSITGSSGARFWGPGTYHSGDLNVTTPLDFGSPTTGSTASNSYAPTVVISGTTTFGASTTVRVANLQGRTIRLGDLEMAGGTFSLIAGSSTTNGTVDGSTNDIRVSSLAGSGTINGAKTATQTTTGSLTVDGSAATTFSGTIVNGSANNVLRLTRSGTGSLTLSGNNTFSGGTVLDGGTLVAAHASALGTGAVDFSGEDEAVLRINQGISIANAITFANSHANSRIERHLDAAEAFSSGVGSLTSSFAGGFDTTAAFLAGTSSSGTPLQFSFAASSAAENDSMRISDVFSLTGTGTDLFVLELSTLNAGDNAYLGWLDNMGFWINAVDGNTDNNASGGQLGFSGTFDDFELLYGSELADYIGAYGSDGNGAVWAVLNHNSDFAIIPEPAFAAWLLAIAALLAVRRTGKARR